MAKAGVKTFQTARLILIVAWCFPLYVNIWRQIGDLHMNGLILLVLWWDRANAIRDFVARLGNVFALDAVNNGKKAKLDINVDKILSRSSYSLRNVNENFRAAIRRRDEAVTFAATEALDGSSYQRVSHRPIRAVGNGKKDKIFINQVVCVAEKLRHS
jgi:hypothetical protein